MPKSGHYYSQTLVQDHYCFPGIRRKREKSPLICAGESGLGRVLRFTDPSLPHGPNLPLHSPPLFPRLTNFSRPLLLHQHAEEGFSLPAGVPAPCAFHKALYLSKTWEACTLVVTGYQYQYQVNVLGRECMVWSTATVEALFLLTTWLTSGMLLVLVFTVDGHVCIEENDRLETRVLRRWGMNSGSEALWAQGRWTHRWRKQGVDRVGNLNTAEDCPLRGSEPWTTALVIMLQTLSRKTSSFGKYLYMTLYLKM